MRGVIRSCICAVIMSLHELAMAQKVSDSVMCVKGEYITHYGSSQEVFQKELIHELYELTNGSYNPLFGSLEMERPKGDAKVFVIAGGGTGIAEYRKLQKIRVPFITGVLHENDVDYQIASDLAVKVISTKCFDIIPETSFQNALECLKSCHTVINCLIEYGEMNKRNLQLCESAKSLGLKVVDSVDMIL